MEKADADRMMEHAGKWRVVHIGLKEASVKYTKEIRLHHGLEHDLVGF